MTDWVDDKVSMMQRRYPSENMLDIAARMAKAEHQRAVRIVKKLWTNSVRIAPWDKAGYRLALSDILTALERGRTGRGR